MFGFRRTLELRDIRVCVVIIDLAMLTLILALVSMSFACDRRFSHLRGLHLLPYLLGTVLLALTFQIRPDLGWEVLVIYPFLLLMHLLFWHVQGSD
jgi:hypothetical protein